MQNASVGPWQFAIPDGWNPKERASSSYFENNDGDKGLYVKSIELTQPKRSPQELATYLQDVHERSFFEGDGTAWEVTDRKEEEDAEVFRSLLDLHDSKANYRVISFVVCTSSEGVQITVHDYWCEDYDATRQQFKDIEASITKLASA